MYKLLAVVMMTGILAPATSFFYPVEGTDVFLRMREGGNFLPANGNCSTVGATALAGTLIQGVKVFGTCEFAPNFLNDDNPFWSGGVNLRIFNTTPFQLPNGLEQPVAYDFSVFGAPENTSIFIEYGFLLSESSYKVFDAEHIVTSSEESIISGGGILNTSGLMADENGFYNLSGWYIDVYSSDLTERNIASIQFVIPENSIDFLQVNKVDDPNVVPEPALILPLTGIAALLLRRHHRRQG
jgi:hypothetical protein